MAVSDPDKLMIKADKLTKLSMTRWSADWKTATVLYEQAGNAYRVRKNYEKAKIAFEKASKGQEMVSSPWDAAKLMESAALMAKELGNWSEVSDLYRRSYELYIECGRSQPASDALAKGARALEDSMPDEAIKLYTDACTALEEDGRDQMAFDLYRDATSIFVKLEKYSDAASLLLKWGLVADKCNATHSQCKGNLSYGCVHHKRLRIMYKHGVEVFRAYHLLYEKDFYLQAYLSAIIVYLYDHDFKQAEKCYNDCSQIDAFLRSDQYRCASKLLSAYEEGHVEDIKRLAQSSIISHLDHVIVKLARKLPTGDVSALKTDAANYQEEALDENDLT